MQSFLDSRHQRVVLNGQSSKWSLVEAGAPQGSILGPLLFLVYINDLPQGLPCNAKLFADDTSLFSTITSPAISSSNLSEDLVKITHWAYQWKMSFNPDITKQFIFKKLFFLEIKITQVIQAYLSIIHQYNENLFKNILVSLEMKSSRFWNISMKNKRKQK